MMGMLRSLGRDWIRAPISGTMVLVAGVMAFLAISYGNVERGLLWLILGNLWIIQRGPFNG